MRESDIVAESGHYWVYRDNARKRYTVFVNGSTHSVSDSAYPLDDDGLSLALARMNYLSNKRKVTQ